MKKSEICCMVSVFSHSERSGRFTEFQMGKKDKSLREGVDTGLFESLTFFALQMEHIESHKAYIRSLGKL